MIASLSSNSLKQYDCALKKWFTYCENNEQNVYEASVPTVLHFLTELYNAGSQYGTLNSCRAALSLILGPQVSKDDRTSRFIKGVYRLRPPQPKYNVTWDTTLVLNKLGTQHPNESLPLETLSKKCVTLLALATGQRVQTLTKININNIELQSTSAIIKITEPLKTSGPNTKQPVLVLPIFPEKPEICPYTTLIHYLDRTKPLRKDDNTALLISFKGPHKNITTQTVSRWIKSVLKDSGIDTSIFTAHSTRHAATSKARQCGVSIDQIRKCAGWSEGSLTFARFYNRIIVNHDEAAFANAIITNQATD